MKERGDTFIWNEDFCEQWWRVINFLTLFGENYIVLKTEKFQFTQSSVNFAGFNKSDHI